MKRLIFEQPQAQRYVGSFVLVLIVCGGFALRVANLGGPAFSDDEIMHVFPAQRLLEGKPPILPSGDLYARSLVYTWTVALSGAIWGINEWSARLPGTIFGALSIFVVYLIGRRWYSSSAGLVAAFLMAVSPMHIAFARQVRMYSMFQLSYLIFIYLFFQAFEGPPRKDSGNHVLSRWARELELNPVLLIVASLVFALATHLHAIMIPAAAGLIGYILVMTLVTIRSTTASRGIKIKYAGSLLIIMAGILCAGIFTDLFDMVLEAAVYTPAWAEISADKWRFYIWVLTEFHPVIFGSSVIAAVWAFTRNSRATAYLAMCFVLPFLLHSAFAQKSPRYILHIIPLLFVLFAVALTAAIGGLRDAVATWGNTIVSPRTSRVVATVVSVAAAAFFLISTGEFRQGIKVPGHTVGEFAGVEHRSWKSVTQFISSRVGGDDVIITTSPGLLSYYGPRRALYGLGNTSLRDLLADPGSRTAGQAVLDYVSGVPMIADVDMLQKIMAEHATGWFVVDRTRFYSPRVVPEDIRRVVEQQWHLAEVPSADDMILWSWKRPIDMKSARLGSF